MNYQPGIKCPRCGEIYHYDEGTHALYCLTQTAKELKQKS